MKKVYFAGKFSLIDDSALSLERRLVNDYRAKLLGDTALLINSREDLIVQNSFYYSGPFYCEQASKGEFTSTDCNVVLEEERRSVTNCDVYIAVFDEDFSVGTVVELGWALNMNKKILILYKEQESEYTICSEYWFAIADAMARSTDVTVVPYQNDTQIVDILKKELNF